MPTCTARLLWCCIRSLDIPWPSPSATAPQRTRTGRRLLGCASAFALVCCGQATLDPEVGARVEQVYAACVEEMLRSTCRVSNDNKPSAAPVFVAGVGQIDSASYRSLRDAGDAMCILVRESCTKAWSGPACRTSRSLWVK